MGGMIAPVVGSGDCPAWTARVPNPWAGSFFMVVKLPMSLGPALRDRGAFRDASPAWCGAARRLPGRATHRKVAPPFPRGGVPPYTARVPDDGRYRRRLTHPPRPGQPQRRPHDKKAFRPHRGRVRFAPAVASAQIGVAGRAGTLGIDGVSLLDADDITADLELPKTWYNIGGDLCLGGVLQIGGGCSSSPTIRP